MFWCCSWFWQNSYCKNPREKIFGIRVDKGDIIKIIGNKRNRDDVLEEYLYYFIKNHNLPNGLIILDASIDRRYKEIFLAVDYNDFDLFLIDIKASKEKIKERIKKKK